MEGDRPVQSGSQGNAVNTAAAPPATGVTGQNSQRSAAPSQPIPTSINPANTNAGNGGAVINTAPVPHPPVQQQGVLSGTVMTPQPSITAAPAVSTVPSTTAAPVANVPMSLPFGGGVGPTPSATTTPANMTGSAVPAVSGTTATSSSAPAPGPDKKHHLAQAMALLGKDNLTSQELNAFQEQYKQTLMSDYKRKGTNGGAKRKTAPGEKVRAAKKPKRNPKAPKPVKPPYVAPNPAIWAKRNAGGPRKKVRFTEWTAVEKKAFLVALLRYGPKFMYVAAFLLQDAVSSKSHNAARNLFNSYGGSRGVLKTGLQMRTQSMNVVKALADDDGMEIVKPSAATTKSAGTTATAPTASGTDTRPSAQSAATGNGEAGGDASGAPRPRPKQALDMSVPPELLALEIKVFGEELLSAICVDEPVPELAKDEWAGYYADIRKPMRSSRIHKFILRPLGEIPVKAQPAPKVQPGEQSTSGAAPFTAGGSTAHTAPPPRREKPKPVPPPPARPLTEEEKQQRAKLEADAAAAFAEVEAARARQRAVIHERYEKKRAERRAKKEALRQAKLEKEAERQAKADAKKSRDDREVLTKKHARPDADSIQVVHYDTTDVQCVPTHRVLELSRTIFADNAKSVFFTTDKHEETFEVSAGDGEKGAVKHGEGSTSSSKPVDHTVPAEPAVTTATPSEAKSGTPIPRARVQDSTPALAKPSADPANPSQGSQPPVAAKTTSTGGETKTQKIVISAKGSGFKSRIRESDTSVPAKLKFTPWTSGYAVAGDAVSRNVSIGAPESIATHVVNKMPRIPRPPARSFQRAGAVTSVHELWRVREMGTRRDYTRRRSALQSSSAFPVALAKRAFPGLGASTKPIDSLRRAAEYTKMTLIGRLPRAAAAARVSALVTGSATIHALARADSSDHVARATIPLSAIEGTASVAGDDSDSDDDEMDTQLAEISTSPLTTAVAEDTDFRFPVRPRWCACGQCVVSAGATSQPSLSASVTVAHGGESVKQVAVNLVESLGGDPMSAPISCIAPSASSPCWVAAGDTQGYIRVWRVHGVTKREDAGKGERRAFRTFQDSSRDPVTNIVWSLGGNVIAAISQHSDTINLWNVQGDGSRVNRKLKNKGTVQCAAFVPPEGGRDTQWLVCALEDTTGLVLWDIGNTKQPPIGIGAGLHPSLSISFNPFAPGVMYNVTMLQDEKGKRLKNPKAVSVNTWWFMMPVLNKVALGKQTFVALKESVQAPLPSVMTFASSKKSSTLPTTDIEVTARGGAVCVYTKRPRMEAALVSVMSLHPGLR